MEYRKDSIVTVDLGNDSASNTFVIDSEETNSVLVTHPLSQGILFRVPKSLINIRGANLKDSSERAIDYANNNKSYLDYNSILDLESLGIYFSFKRKLTPRQKHTVATICGIIASAKFNEDINSIMKFISKNSSMLDEFNLMWYNNFKSLFLGDKQIVSKKQRQAIYNIAGYLLAELENPITPNSK